MSEKVHIGPWPGSRAEPEPHQFSLENESDFLIFKASVERAEQQVPDDIANRMSQFDIDQLNEELSAVEKMSDQEIVRFLNEAIIDWVHIPHFNYYLIKEARMRLEQHLTG